MFRQGCVLIRQHLSHAVHFLLEQILDVCLEVMYLMLNVASCKFVASSAVPSICLPWTSSMSALASSENFSHLSALHLKTYGDATLSFAEIVLNTYPDWPFCWENEVHENLVG